MTGSRASSPAPADRDAAARRLFEQAAAADPDARRALLQAARRDDPEVCDEVEGLLRHHQRDDGLLDRAPAELIRTDADASAPPAPIPARPAESGPGATLAPGKRVVVGGGHSGCTITRTLHAGSIGVLYEAEQASPPPPRPIALRLIRDELVTAEMVRRFRHDGAPLILPPHPGIARVHEIGVATIDGRDRPFIAAELVRGQTLAEFARRIPLSTRQRLLLTAAIADAVQHAHDHGLIHGALTTARVLVDLESPPSGSGRAAAPPLPHIKLIGFGLARLTGDQARAPAGSALSPAAAVAARAAAPVAAPGYAAPELSAAGIAHADARADIYSIGAILYELLTGRRPAGPAAPTPPRRFDRALSADIDAVVLRAVAPAPADRYARAADLAADLRRAVAGEPVSARPPTRLGALWRRRRPWIIGAIAILATLLGALAKALVQR